MSNIENWNRIVTEADKYGFSFDEMYETDLEGLYDFEKNYDDAGVSPLDFG